MLLILLVSHFILELVCGKYIVWNEGTPFPVKGDGNRISKTFIWCPASSGPRESCSRLGSWWYCDWQGMNPCVMFLICPGNWSMWGGARRDLDYSHMDLIRWVPWFLLHHLEWIVFHYCLASKKSRTSIQYASVNLIWKIFGNCSQ